MHKNAHARKRRDLYPRTHTHILTHSGQIHLHIYPYGQTHDTPHAAHIQTLNYGQSWATVAWFIADGAGTQLLTFAQVVKLQAPENQYIRIYVPLV